MKTFTEKDHSFRVEIVSNDLLGTEIAEPQDYFETWKNNILFEADKWSKKSEKAKKTYQKKYFEIERIICDIDENNQLYARFHLKLNTDWTWNVMDLKNNVEYQHCSPVSVNDNLKEELRDDNIILHIPGSIVDKHYYDKKTD